MSPDLGLLPPPFSLRGRRHSEGTPLLISFCLWPRRRVLSSWSLRMVTTWWRTLLTCCLNITIVKHFRTKFSNTSPILTWKSESCSWCLVVDKRDRVNWSMARVSLSSVVAKGSARSFSPEEMSTFSVLANISDDRKKRHTWRYKMFRTKLKYLKNTACIIKVPLLFCSHPQCWWRAWNFPVPLYQEALPGFGNLDGQLGNSD